MSLTSLFLTGVSMMSLTGVSTVTDRFDADVRGVDAIEVVHPVAQLDSEKRKGQGKRVDVIENIQSPGPAYPYTRPANR